jgi:hypothetical protein
MYTYAFGGWLAQHFLCTLCFRLLEFRLLSPAMKTLFCVCRKICSGPCLFCRSCLYVDIKIFSMSPLSLETDKCNLLELQTASSDTSGYTVFVYMRK